MFANKDKFLHRNCKRNCSMSFNITPSPVTQSYRLYTTGEKNKCIKMFWGKCGTAQKACVTGGFCLPSAKMGGARSLAFTRVFAPDLLHICLSPTQPFLSRHATIPPKGEGGVGEGGALLTKQKRLCLSWDCVFAEQIRSYSGQRLTHLSRLSQTSPSAARDVMGRRKTPCSRRARCAKTTGDEPGSQVKRRTSHVTNPILRSEIYCCSSQV